uniref:Uncharacterized protein n=1 Tax=Cacopsylla melanoneura TaxID=428564 RepID=A0A8D8VXS1_9HEMI
MLESSHNGVHNPRPHPSPSLSHSHNHRLIMMIMCRRILDVPPRLLPYSLPPPTSTPPPPPASCPCRMISSSVLRHTLPPLVNRQHHPGQLEVTAPWTYLQVYPRRTVLVKWATSHLSTPVKAWVWISLPRIIIRHHHTMKCKTSPCPVGNTRAN